MVYSVAIRSVRDNEFLRQTLGSLQEQTILPKEIVIAIPADVQPWDAGEVGVRFVAAERGMVTQRAAGILAADTEYLLLLDDDVVLAPSAAQLLLQIMRDQQAACVVPYWNEGWPKTKSAKILMTFWGIALSQAEGGIRYTPGGGYFYPQQEPAATPYETHGGSGAVILVNRGFCLENECLGDVALQAVSAYALREDGAFILDIFRKGGRCFMIGGVRFNHLGGTTRLDPSRLEMAYTAQIYNQYLFWKNYIKPQYSKTVAALFLTRLAISWYLLGIIMFGLLAATRARTFQPLRGLFMGMRLIYSSMV